MLEMGRDLPIDRHHRPPVTQRLDLPRPQVEHRLDGQDQARLQPQALSRPPVVRHLRVFVRPRADTVPGQRLRHTTARRDADPLDRRADVPDVQARARGIDTAPQRILGHFQQTPHPGLDLSNREGHRPVPIVPLVTDPHVDADDVTLTEDPLPRRDAVHDLVIDARAQRRRKAVQPLERRRRVVVAADALFRPLVQFARAHARSYLVGDLIQHLRDDLASSRDQLDLIVRLQPDQEQSNRLSSFFCTSSTVPTASSSRSNSAPPPYQPRTASVFSR